MAHFPGAAEPGSGLFFRLGRLSLNGICVRLRFARLRFEFLKYGIEEIEWIEFQNCYPR